jgi:prevent-host-death family protein
MRKVKIAELKDRLSEHLRAVEGGEEVIVTDRNRPIARIVPVVSQQATLTVDAPTVSFKTIRAKKWRAAGWRLSADELLDEERRER